MTACWVSRGHWEVGEWCLAIRASISLSLSRVILTTDSQHAWFDLIIEIPVYSGVLTLSPSGIAGLFEDLSSNVGAEVTKNISK